MANDQAGKWRSHERFAYRIAANAMKGLIILILKTYQEAVLRLL